jgi:hypothetical protein
MVFLPNPPVEDAAGGEADKSLCLPCLPNGMFLKFLFHRGEMPAQLNPYLTFSRRGAYFSEVSLKK